jgi:hypothetical protein
MIEREAVRDSGTAIVGRDQEPVVAEAGLNEPP